MSEIKPCPFCGTSMVVLTKDTFSHPGTLGSSQCLLAGRSYFWKHIDWWNTRAGEPIEDIEIIEDDWTTQNGGSSRPYEESDDLWAINWDRDR